LFVSNVPFTATEEQVKAIFAKFGEVKSISVNKGLAFIDMANPDIALRAIDSGRNGELFLEGRTLKVEEKKPPKQGGGFRGDRGDQRGPREKRPDQRGDRADRAERPDRGERINGKTSAPRDQRRQ
jgi:RNA recognition motif-containing protein